jgi:Holliday junction DNA helicase RuvA
MDSASFARCVQHGDVSSLVALPGVGKKTAERLLVEMRDKLVDWLGMVEAEQAGAGSKVPGRAPDIVADAEGALVALGYKPAEASRVVAAVNDDGVDDSEELIRRALKSMVSA